ncbi:MAG TPA: hypothetical protein VII34_04880 [Pyrinomonadaceae bacterium]
MMDYKNAIRYAVSAAVILCAIGLTTLTTKAQEPVEGKKPVAIEKSSGRDPFKKYVAPAPKPGKALPSKLEAPPIQVRIDRYRAQKLAAASAHVAPPKPTSVLLLNEMQVIGIFRTPRGFAAMIEATPIKLSYVIYPGESFFDGQLVAIEESRLVFRRDIVWTDGRHDKTVETKPLRQASPVEAMTAAKTAPANAPAPEPEKPAVPEKQ